MRSLEVYEDLCIIFPMDYSQSDGEKVLGALGSSLAMSSLCARERVEMSFLEQEARP